MEVGIDLAAKGLVSLLNQHRGDFDAALSSVLASERLKVIFPYYHENIDNDVYPFLMIQEVDESMSWYGLPNIMQNAFKFNIYGFVSHDDPETCVNLRRALASSVKTQINRRSDGFVLANGEELEFGGVNVNPPIYSISYNVSISGANAMVRGFVASFWCNAFPSVPIRG